MTLAIQAAISLLLLVAYFAAPQIARRGLLFGVLHPEGFQFTEAGDRAVRSYNRALRIAWAPNIITMWLRSGSWFLPASLVTFAIVGIAAFIVQNHKL